MDSSFESQNLVNYLKTLTTRAVATWAMGEEEDSSWRREEAEEEEEEARA